MVNINVKKLMWRIFLIFWNIFAIIGVCITACFLYIIFDDAGWCLNSGKGVWDSEQKICRKDCLSWSKETGCEPVTKENAQKKD